MAENYLISYMSACCWIEFDGFHLINTSFQKVSHLNLMT